MSEENVEVVRRGYEALNRGDVPELLETMAPDVELVSVLSELGGGVFRGHEGIERYVAEVAEGWADTRWTVTDAREVDDHRLVATVQFRARGQQSGIAVDRELGVLFTIENGKTTRAEGFLDPEAALEAAGLSE